MRLRAAGSVMGTAMLRKSLLFCRILLLWLCACSIPPAIDQTGMVTPRVEPPTIPTATPDCQPAAGVTLQVWRGDDTKVMLRATGLQPGENPFVFYSTATVAGGMRGESSNFAKGADEHGEFTIDLPGLQPVQGQSKVTWDIRLIHRRGVACASITLP